MLFRSKEVRARERARLRRDAAEHEEKNTATQINDKAEEAVTVRDADDAGALVAVLIASASASKEAVAMYLTAISREISFRCAQMDARIY